MVTFLTMSDILIDILKVMSNSVHCQHCTMVLFSHDSDVHFSLLSTLDYDMPNLDLKGMSGLSGLGTLDTCLGSSGLSILGSCVPLHKHSTTIVMRRGM